MELKQIEAFLKIVEKGSFSAAAEELFIAQPTISQRIQQLEQELNVSLFNRIEGKRVQLSDAGKALYPIFEEGYNCFEKAVQVSKGLTNAKKTFTIAVPNNFGSEVLAELLKQLNHIFKNVDFPVRSGTSTTIVENIADNRIDAGFVYEIPPGFKNDTVTSMRVANGKNLLVCSPEHSLASGQHITPTALKDENILIYGKNFISSRIIEQYFEKHNVRNVRLVEIFNPGTVKSMAMAGEGIALLQEMDVIKELQSGKLVSIQLRTSIPPTPIILVFNNATQTEIKYEMFNITKKIFE